MAGPRVPLTVVTSQNEVLGRVWLLTSTPSESFCPGAQDRFSAALAGLASTAPDQVAESQLCPAYIKGSALVPSEFDHAQQALPVMSDGEMHTFGSHQHGGSMKSRLTGPLWPSASNPAGPQECKTLRW